MKIRTIIESRSSDQKPRAQQAPAPQPVDQRSSLLELQQLTGNCAFSRFLSMRATPGRPAPGVSLTRGGAQVQRMRFEWIKADKSRVTVDTSDENGTHYNSKWAANYFVSYYYLRKRSMTKSDMQDALAWLSHFKKRSRDMEDAIIDLRERLEAGGRLDDTTTPTIEASPEAHDVRPVVKKRRMVKDAASGELRSPTSGERWARSLGKGGPEWVETETVELEKVPFPRPTDTQRKTAHIIEARLWDEKVEQGLALKGLKVSNAILKKYGVWPADYPKHDAAAVKARYKQTHILCHPDKNPEIDPDVFPALRAAWEYYFTETGEARVTLGDI